MLGLLMVGTFKIERDRLVRLVMFVLFDFYAIRMYSKYFHLTTL